MLRGEVFAEQVFHNEVFALFINTFLNGTNGVASNYLNDMEVTYSGANLSIASGAVCIQGRFLEETSTGTIAVSGASLYHKLVIEIDLDKTNTAEDFQQAYYKIVSQSGSYPTLTQTDIVKNVAGIYQYELARFRTDGSGNITNFEDKRTFLDISSIYTAIQSATTTLLNGIESNANTLISELQSEIAGVEDTSDFIMKTQIRAFEKNVTPTQSGGTYTASVNFELPGGWTNDKVVVLRLMEKEYTGVGYFYKDVDGLSRYGYWDDNPTTTIQFNDIEVTSDCVAIKVILMRV